jgi:hypothetical protein
MSKSVLMSHNGSAGSEQGAEPMSLFSKIRQVYDQLCGRKEAATDPIRQEREHLSEQTDNRERRLAVERDSKLLGLMTGG